MWFRELTGFGEDEVADVGANFTVDGDCLTSKINGRRLRFGEFETPTLGQLRQRTEALLGSVRAVGLSVREVVADVGLLHADPANQGSLFQVASQFNTLEMIDPGVTPEDGIERYASDPTQGPACAVACGAGTIFRNYLVPLGAGTGQTADRQIDCLAPLADALGVSVPMRNGYALPGSDVLDTVAGRLMDATTSERDSLLANLRIGLQWETEVTRGMSEHGGRRHQGGGHSVSQAYCSAMPVAYSHQAADRWEPFARLVLDAAYEATFHAALINGDRTGNHTLHLTLLGGGVFGNPTEWILDAIERAALRLRSGSRSPADPVAQIDVAVVSYRQANRDLQPLLDRLD